MNIKVALRIRPFNAREKQMKSDLCVKMDDQTTYLLDEEGKPKKRTFTVDHCFWSFDGFSTDDNGYNHPLPNSNYSDQKKVYDILGREMLDNAVEGFHTCLFAYGQTGAGKSYSIFGYGTNKGIVPLLCDQLFNGDVLKKDAVHSFVLNISMLEIYNEKAQDLLIPVNKRTKSGLKVRENAQIGVYVDQLTKHKVESYKEIENMINEGNKNRTLASTFMNATSSRAHTIITIEVVQKKITKKTETQKVSIINLVDLAGSEKVSKTGARNDRLKEACSINKSLSVLGIVINQLFKKSEGKKTIVSYRDSILTRILQNALGGNSKTTMICAISPARDNIEETLSTLRYAEQAKRIKLNAKVNESETDKLIRELTAENERLKKQLAAKDGNGMEDDIKNQIKTIEEAIEGDNIEAISPHKTANLSMIPQFKKLSPEQIKTCPHLTNLNEDPLLNAMIFYNFKEHPLIRIGREVEGEESKDEKRIVLNGIGVLEDHATLVYMDGNVTLMIAELDAASNTFINGDSMDGFVDPAGNGFLRQLNNFDRIIIGTGTTFLLRLPSDGVNLDKPEVDGKTIDWEFCQIEKLKNQEMNGVENDKKFYEEQQNEIIQRETNFQFDFDREKALYEGNMRMQKEQYEKNIEQLQQQLAVNEKEKLELKKAEEEKAYLEAYRKLEVDLKQRELEHHENLGDLQKEARRLKAMQQINENLEQKLISYYPRIIEANAVAQALHRNVTFQPFVASLNVFSALNVTNATTDLLINIKVVNNESGWVNYWGLEKFENRLQLMRDAVEHFFSTNQISYNDETDPFWDPKQFSLLAQGICIMKSILYRFVFKVEIGLIGFENELGTCSVTLLPVDGNNKEIDEDDDENFFEDLEELIEEKLPCHFRVEINKLKFSDIADLNGKRVYVEFEVLSDSGPEIFRTKDLMVKESVINVNHAFFVKLSEVNEEVIDFYLNSKLQVKVFVEDLEVVEVIGKDLPPIIVNSGEKKIGNRYKISVPKRITNLPGRIDSDDEMFKKKDGKKKDKKKKKKKKKGGRARKDSNVCVVW